MNAGEKRHTFCFSFIYHPGLILVVGAGSNARILGLFRRLDISRHRRYQGRCYQRRNSNVFAVANDIIECVSLQHKIHAHNVGSICIVSAVFAHARVPHLARRR